MRYITHPAFTALIILIASQADAQAVNPVDERDQQQFNELYKVKLTNVRATRGADDDLGLAAEMLAFAQTIPDSPGVRCLIYIEAIPLASNGGDLASAINAARQLASLWPGHPASDPEALLEQAEKAYREASRIERPEVAEPYIELLIVLAEQAEADDDLDHAVALCRQANTVARVVDSAKRGMIEKTLNRLSAASTLALRIENLSAAVRNNPQNKRAAGDLVELLVIEKGNPAAAAAFAPMTGDEELAEVVAMAAGGVEDATAPDALRVGDWYAALAERQSDDKALPLLRAAHRWYARFLAIYPREDALALRVASVDQRARGKAERIIEAQRAAMRGQWIDLVRESFDPTRHALGEGLVVQRGEVISDGTSFVLPISPEGDYELRLRLTLQAGSPGLVVHMPVSRSAATVRYAWNNNSISMIDSVNARDRNPDRMNTPGRPVELVFQAAVLENNQVALAMLIDGEQSVRWQGPADRLRPDRNHLPPEAMGRVVRISCPGQATFHAIELRERGE